MTGVRVGAALALAALSGAAAAHPVHEVVQNAYLTVAPGTVELELELTAGPQVAGSIVRALDADRDGRISAAEARRYAAGVLSASRLTVDGHALHLRGRSVSVPPVAALLGAHGTIVIFAGAARPDAAAGATLAYRNDYRPAESRCDANIFLAGGSTAHERVTWQRRSTDGRELTVRLAPVRRWVRPA